MEPLPSTALPQGEPTPEQPPAGAMPDWLEPLNRAAAAAAECAYAPYSKFRVGAALLLDTGEIATGANVENASLGLTICAERSAIAAAVCQCGPMVHWTAAAVVNLNDAPSAPCGACRQVLHEFAAPGALISFPIEEGIAIEPLEALLPYGFRL